jgi:hypothetical protein
VAFPCVSQNFDSARLFRPYTTQAHRHFFRMSDAAAMWCARRMRAEAVHSARFEAMIEVKAPLTSLNRLLFQQTCQQRSGTYTSMNGRGPRAGRLSKSSVARSAPWTDFGDLYRLWTNSAKSTPEGMKAIPPESDIPVTIGATNPVVKLVCPTNDSIGLAAVGVAKTLTAE